MERNPEPLAPMSAGHALISRAFPAHNLPRPLTPLVGRDQEKQEIIASLESARLITLTGIGGVGKTRLAVEVGTALAGSYADGVWLVELAACTNEEALLRQIASTLGVREEPGRALTDSLLQHLKPRSLLLILDNCEHLVEACAALIETLLRHSPHLHFLVTSRRLLNISGEHIRRVPPLSLPNLPLLLHGATDTDALLEESGAVRLFVERGAMAQRAFQLTPANMALVAQICHLVDGIPFAIELAAAWLKALPVEQIVARLHNRLQLLTDGSRTALPHQQTLRATLDWSYQLLSEPEKSLLARLSVFVDGWTLEAAEAVCAEPLALEYVLRLQDASFVVAQEVGTEMRYRLLETVREYATEQLTPDEAHALAERHAAFFASLVFEAETHYFESDPGAWYDQLEREHGNLRAALDWLSGQGETETALKMAGSLAWFWYVRGYITEGRMRLEMVLSQADAAPPAVRAKAFSGAGTLAFCQGEYAAAQRLHARSLELFRQTDDAGAIGFALNDMGLAASALGDLDSARAFYEESLSIMRAGQPPESLAYTLSLLGRVMAEQGELDAARELLQESLSIMRSQGQMSGIADAAEGLGYVRTLQGVALDAIALHEESLVLRRKLGDKPGIANALLYMGDAAFAARDAEKARACWQESLTVYRELGDSKGVAETLHHLGLEAFRGGDTVTASAYLEESLMARPTQHDARGAIVRLESLAVCAQECGLREAATRLFGAASALRETLPYPLPERTETRRAIIALRAEVDDMTFATVWNQGRGLPFEQAIVETFATR